MKWNVTSTVELQRSQEPRSRNAKILLSVGASIEKNSPESLYKHFSALSV